MADDDDDDDVATILDGSFNTRLGNLDQEIGGVVLPGTKPNPVVQKPQDYDDDGYEYYDDDDDYEYYDPDNDGNRALGPVSPEPVPIRKSKWHPQVGLAPSPNVKDVGSKLDSRNRNYKPHTPRKVEIFNDKEYLKRVKSPKFGRKSKSAVVESTRTIQSPEGELLSSKRQQRSREGSLYRVKTADVVSHTQYEAAFSKKGYEVKPKPQEDWKAKSARLQKEHEQLQVDIKRMENDNRNGHYKYYNSNGTQTLDRMTSAEKKLAEVDRQRKLLEKEERNFLLDKEKSQKKLELEERNFLLELKRVELARKRIEQLERDELKMMENTQALEKSADKKLRILEEERFEK
ncbi:uncharacterized protein LOC111708451 isoform X2 [Eurytemora carolleeae]|uniref:uncharacterized protein LOC111708451 isoform X2 n=1 Tax=Eurytemora carolleeae TaxID=1294199 RepID=UPI000C77D9BF|nr:uncharacterized protein LOC111708451 isoform X2 [Eurytemora carolleeae]|eukprot:XP_023337597.1 uncharacterized protein LOC111708451 isoform X2 [Eurytemora affinis]